MSQGNSGIQPACSVPLFTREALAAKDANTHDVLPLDKNAETISIFNFQLSLLHFHTDDTPIAFLVEAPDDREPRVSAELIQFPFIEDVVVSEKGGVGLLERGRLAAQVPGHQQILVLELRAVLVHGQVDAAHRQFVPVQQRRPGPGQVARLGLILGPHRDERLPVGPQESVYCL